MDNKLTNQFIFQFGSFTDKDEIEIQLYSDQVKVRNKIVLNISLYYYEMCITQKKIILK